MTCFFPEKNSNHREKVETIEPRHSVARHVSQGSSRAHFQVDQDSSYLQAGNPPERRRGSVPAKVGKGTYFKQRWHCRSEAPLP